MARPGAVATNKLLGRGSVEVIPLNASTLAHEGGIPLGDCSSFSYTITPDVLEDVSMVEATSLPDVQILKGQKCSIKCTLKEFNAQNNAIFSRGTLSVLAQSSGNMSSVTFLPATVTTSNRGRWFEGSKRNWTSSSLVILAGGTSLVIDTDYKLDLVGGRVFILSTSSASGALTATGTYGADTSETVEGYAGTGYHAVRFVGAPFTGPKLEYLFYQVLVTADGDLPLLGESIGSFGIKGDCVAQTVSGSSSFFNLIVRP
jgi:hypothetical protein